ncbi:M20/M25/M40 family metallo-hydrolase [Maribacter sp. ACAM166]|uniref:M20/M25/M40 family metallo-hydrolase n=1 Tax=Maribacter sp. ACAM166 TaxID=2508996 RepID=UPI0010FD61E8|nr:M20/M25/M40 family metallo-hydrolase [Maribacter sp. ACAM166]TLP80226.1 M20/M25/M40 family metallo-hydrolase [Maribacter sp. ACAM166]
MTRKAIVLIFILLPFTYLCSQNLDELSLKYAKASFTELHEFFSLPNDAYNPEEIEPNVKWCEVAFAKRGFKTQRLETETVPLLLATRNFPNAKKTVLVYLQVDGQPVDTLKWNQPDPYIPALKKKNETGNWEIIDWNNLDGDIDPDWRIFSRSASDARGPNMMFLKAMDIINDLNIKPNVNLKVIMDFEEELGSPRLPKAVVDYKNDLGADMLVIFDGPRHLSNEPTLSYGARGIATISLEVFGPRTPLHSGNYGNYAPNPAVKLSQLLATMWHEDGRVAIPGWYDGITITDEVKAILRQVPDDEDQIQKDFGIASTDNIGTNFQEAIQYPALGILGLESAWVGNKTRTIIPATAIAEMNIRLVRETKGERMVKLLKDHIINQDYYLVDEKPTEEERMTHEKIARFNSEISYGAFRTDFDTEIGAWLRKGMKSAFNKDPIQIRTMGGSIPISPFVITLGLPAVAVPTVNPDNNQHSPNENIRLGNYIEGIKTITAIFMQKI